MGEPRIHFAINCASKSCPKLLNKAYEEKQIENQLVRATNLFLLDTTKNIISDKNLKLSRIFFWFGNDFGSKKQRLEFISNYSGLKIENSKIEYLKYDWSLNEQ
jgi:hypothetical protein